jgi:hypothetical protein
LFDIQWTDEAKEVYSSIKRDPSKKARYKAVKKTITLLAGNPRHPGLQTHRFYSLEGPNGEKIFIAYAQQKTPAAYRIFWYYGSGKNTITILTIPSHP